MLDLTDVAARLDADEKFKLRYRFPTRSADGQVEYEIRMGKLLDVAEDAQLLYVSREGEVIWVKVDEAVEILPDDQI